MPMAKDDAGHAKRGLGTYVANELAERVFSGRYKSGTMLPTEVDLVNELDVSRVSVRSGLQTLATLGIISRQAGKGTVVEEFSEWNLLDPTVTAWMVDYADPNFEFLKEVFEFRYLIEPVVSALAAVRATARDLAAIEDAYLEMGKGQMAADPAVFTAGDIAFHASIYRATHNPVWVQMSHILKPAITLIIRKSNTTADELGDSLSRHRQVFESIRLRQPERAFDAARHVMDRTGLDLGMTPESAENKILALLKARSLPEHD